ncbi:MAG: hypothetical protein HUJ31_16995, partial [Pseudomonadales bacterium]|nr:hypothetical protein [Pseudomonadales bacterium]
MKRALDYIKKAKIQRQIQSNRAEKYKALKIIDIILTVFLAGLIAFLSFTGLPQKYAWLQLFFYFITFGLVMFVTFHYAFRVGEKEQECWRAVVALSSFINEVEDLVSQAQRGLITFDLSREDVLKHKYDALMANIPENSDRDFVKAKADFREKEKATSIDISVEGGIFDVKYQSTALQQLIRNSDTLLELLKAMRTTN